MTATEIFFRSLLLSSFLVGFCVSSKAQSYAFVDRAATAQAKTQEEFDQYLDVVTAPDAQSIVVKVDALISQFPQSELLAAAYQYKMRACEQLNDFECMLSSGREALQRNPDDTNTLLTLAPAIASKAAERVDRDALLAEAESDAHHVLEKVDSQRIPREISQEQWALRKSQMESEAHGALGLVALQRHQTGLAIQELKEAIHLVSNPTGIQFLRLGLALNANGNKADAREKFRRAIDLGPDPVKTIATNELKKLPKQPKSQKSTGSNN
jgi:tetratricopeptide (TPR) repeat protein